MKNMYLIVGAMLLSTVAMAQSGAGKAYVKKNLPLTAKPDAARAIGCPDTAGLVNFVDFQPEFAANSGSAVIYGYSGGGFVFGNNVDDLEIVGQGFVNLSGTPVKVEGVLAWFGGKEMDGTSSTTSKVTFTTWDMADNKSYNTNGSGTFNSTTLNHPGPTGSAKATADLLFADIDTVDFNYIAFGTPSNHTGDFMIVADFSTLAPGDTAGLVSDDVGDANNLDFTFHKYGTKWYVTDQLFSDAATGGSGGIDNNVALWAVLCDATGINEFYNGMKLTSYPNPAADKATTEYALERNSSNVQLVIYDQAGRKVYENKMGEQSAGAYKVNLETVKLASGVYFYQLSANGAVFTKKLSIAK